MTMTITLTIVLSCLEVRHTLVIHVIKNMVMKQQILLGAENMIIQIANFECEYQFDQKYKLSTKSYTVFAPCGAFSLS